MTTTEIIVIIIATLTLFFAALSFFSSISAIWFKRKLPMDFGFLYMDQILDNLKLSTGDNAKKISFRFRNKSKTTLIDVVIALKFMRPLSLSGTNTALTYIINKVSHGSDTDGNYYFIRHFDLELPGEELLDFQVELNTKDISVGNYNIEVTCYSKTQNYKYSRKILKVNIS